jgi:hypothetical protein
VARSFVEAEMMAAGQAVREAVWLTWLKCLIVGECSAIPISCDSAGALSIIHNPVLEDMRKHIDVILHHVREWQDTGYADFSWVSSSDNVADILPKRYRGQSLKSIGQV